MGDRFNAFDPAVQIPQILPGTVNMLENWGSWSLTLIWNHMNEISYESLSFLVLKLSFVGAG